MTGQRIIRYAVGRATSWSAALRLAAMYLGEK
jgi:hypothetical protein